MAVKLAKKNNVFNMQQRTFYIDDESDLDAIEAEYDCGIGDVAECPDGTIYRRHSDGYEGELWEKKGSSKGGGGGGNNSLPAITDADIGKILQVQGSPSASVAVPEQTVTFVDAPVSLVNADTDAFVAGKDVAVIINDVEYTGQMIEANGSVGWADPGGDFGIVNLDNAGVVFITMTPGTYTVSLDVIDQVPAWSKGEATMIAIYDESTHKYDKTWQEVYDALMAGITVYMQYVYIDQQTGDINFIRELVTNAVYASEVSKKWAVATVAGYAMNNDTSEANASSNIYIADSANGYLYVNLV